MTDNDEITTPTKRPPLYKQRFIINPRLQWELIFFISGACIISIGSLYFGMRGLLGHLADRCMLIEPQDNCRELLKIQQNSTNILFLGSLIIAVLTSVGGGIFLSHRIAGPLFRLVMNFRKIGLGKYRKLSFRKNDYFQDIVQVYNENVIETLNQLQTKKNAD